MNTAIPASLADALTDFLNDCRTERSSPYGDDDSFSLVEFLAEAIFCAESNELHGVPAVTALLERLDECLEPQSGSPGPVLQWFDAP